MKISSREDIIRARAKTHGEAMMMLFCLAIETGKIPDADVLQFFSAAFLKILNRENPKKALGIERQQSSGNVKHHPGRDHAIMVARYMRGTPKLSYGKAIEAVMEKTGLPHKTIKNHYSAHKLEVNGEVYPILRTEKWLL